jgi:acetyltransferase EpsM
MRPRDLVVVGGGEHARVVIEAARSRSDVWRVLGFVDPQTCEETSARLGVSRLGDDGAAAGLTERGACFVLGLGGVGVSPRRREVVARWDALRAEWASVVHAQAWVSPTAEVGAGAVVFAGAIVNTGARLGNHSVVNTGAVVEHDVLLGAFAQAAPACAIGGGAHIGEGSYLGLGCRIRDHVRLGRDVIVGMGAAVVAHVPDGRTVVGVPAKVRQA